MDRSGESSRKRNIQIIICRLVAARFIAQTKNKITVIFHGYFIFSTV